MDQQKVRSDFDQIARLSVGAGHGTERYDSFLLSLVPAQAREVLDIGCGLGRLTGQLLDGDRQITALDLSPEMIRRARENLHSPLNLSFVCADFLQHDFGGQTFDCIISVATLHHLPEDDALNRMKLLLRPGGRLIIHDLRRAASILDWTASSFAFAHDVVQRLWRTGRARPTHALRSAWTEHGRTETYLTLAEAREIANRVLPGAHVYRHWLWRYTIVWNNAQP